MKIALAQTNTTVGDLCGNGQRVLSFARQAAESGADVVVFPELTLTGYPPRDLLGKQSFLDRAEQHLHRLAAEAANLDVSIICGAVTRSGISSGNPIYNSAAVLEGGRIAFRQHKMLLPTYDVFDEARYFEPAPKQDPLTLGASIAALTICEDAWNDKQYSENTFLKPPSAELRHDQKDSDSLPDYAVLDQMLEGYVENNASPQQIADSLHLSVTLVRDIVNKVDRNEYKRQQAAPGLKVTTKAFGVGRRFPIAQRFSE